MTKLRISAHLLQIEVGRHQKMDIKNRTCSICNSNELEDKKHFLIRCKQYANERQALFDKLKIQNDQTDHDKLISLLTNKNNKQIREISEFIHNCFKLRENNIKHKQPAASQTKLN